MKPLFASASAALLVMVGASAAAHAQEVAVTATGTIDVFWFWDDTGYHDDPPAALADAFPVGAPFTASFTYDPAEQSYIGEYNGASRYAGAMTSWAIVVNGHTISPEWGSSYPPQVWVSDTTSWGDGLSGLVDALVDGSQTFGGHEVVTGTMTIVDNEGAALSSQALPTQVCLGAFEELITQVQFYPGSGPTFYFLDGSAIPDRSVDSDGDGLTDGAEIHGTGTDPCSADTDGDGADDAVDPDPLVPELSDSQLSELVRDTAVDVLEIPEPAFEGPNPNAQRGRRNALANRLQAAANELEAGNLQEALQILTNARKLLDGDPSPPDVMADGPEKAALLAEIDALMALIENAIAT